MVELRHRRDGLGITRRAPRALVSKRAGQERPSGGDREDRDHVVYGASLVAMLGFLWIARRPRSPLFLLIAVVPDDPADRLCHRIFLMALVVRPLLNASGAFTLKPFMPTVFGDGRAQFSTHSYPAIGFALMLVVAVFMALAVPDPAFAVGPAKD